MTWLLDGNLLVALAIDSHVHHERARRWFDAMSEPFATCAVTEGTLLRLHMRFAVDKSVAAAWAELDAIHAMASHEFWDEGFGYREVKHDALTGPAQVTDTWLAELARRRGGKLATVDGGLVTLHPDVAVLVPELPTAPQAS